MKKHILVADDDSDIVELLARRLEGSGFSVDTANNAMTALGKVEESLPDLAILDVDMPYGDGLSVCEMMAGHDELEAIPVVVLTGNADESTIRRCHALCAYYVLKGPGLWARVAPIIDELFGVSTMEEAAETRVLQEQQAATDASEPDDLMDTVFAVLGVEEGECLESSARDESRQQQSKPWVLSIEDDDDVALALKLRLQEMGVQVIRATDGSGGYRSAYLDAPKAIILDYELPQGNGDYVLRRLKDTPDTRDIPVIVLTGRREASVERQMRGLGAAEFFNKPFEWARLGAALKSYLAESPPAPTVKETLPASPA